MTRQMWFALSVLLLASVTTAAQSSAPPARSGHVMTTAGPTGGVLMLGGAAEPDDVLWRLAGPTWESLGPGGPVNRTMMAAAYDTRRGVLVAFGGIGPRSGSRYGETWEWDGRSWRERDVRSPGSRDHHAMVFDEARGHVVMYGGWDINKVFQPDTWTWDGTAWTKVDSSTGPGGLGHLAMAYDRRRQRVVLFGGDGPDRPATSDTWEWDGTRWEKVATTGPEPRTRHRLAYDAARGVTVMFGGQIGSGPSSVFPQDTWTWDGRAWTRIVAPGPSPRYMPAMAYDERRERVIMSGGSLGARPFSALNDTWEWDGARWREVSSHPQWGTLEPGAYRAGFRIEQTTDVARARTLPVTTWYPAAPTRAARPLPFSELLARLGGGDATTAAANFAAALRPMQSLIGGKLVPLFPDGFSDDRVATMGLTPTASFADAPPADGRFPALLYLGAAEEHSVLFEYLASHGYVVAVVPNLGTSPEFPGSSDPDRVRRERVKADDMAHLLAHVRGLPNVDPTRLGVFGTGVGMTAAARLQIEQAQVGLLVLTNAPRGLTPEDLARLRAPMLFLLADDQSADAQASVRAAIESMRHAERYLLHFTSVGHPQLSSVGRLGDPGRAARDTPYDLMVTTIRQFLDATFRSDAAARTALTARTGAPLGAR